MKKKLLITFLIVFCLGFIKINTAYADSLGFSCEDTSIAVGETTTCKVVGTVDHPSRGVIGKLGSDSHLEISGITNISPFTDGRTPIYYYKASAVPAGNYDIVRFTVTALAEGTGSLTLRDFGGDDGLGFIDATGDTFYYLDPVTFPLTVTGGDVPPTPKSDDSSLTNLVPNVGQLVPEFASNVFAYSMDIDFTRVSRVTFTATKSHPMASVGDTECPIPDSTTVESVTCNIVVTAEDRVSTSTYSITFNNTSYTPTPPTPEADIYITSLTYDVDAVLTPTFKKDIYNYEMSVNFANVHEINFTTATSEEGITVTGKKCTLPNSSSVISAICNIGITKGGKSQNYKILVHNTYTPDIHCDLIIRSNVYTIDQTNKIIKVNSEHSLETIKSNLYSTCGEIKVYQDKAVILDNIGSSEYKIERVIMPQTGNNVIIYPLAIVSVLAIIGIFIFIRKKYFKKEI